MQRQIVMAYTGALKLGNINAALRRDRYIITARGKTLESSTTWVSAPPISSPIRVISIFIGNSPFHE